MVATAEPTNTDRATQMRIDIPEACETGVEPTVINLPFITKVTPERERFDTGSQRGSRKGKGRFDLLPMDALRFVGDVTAQLIEEGEYTFDDNLDDVLESLVDVALMVGIDGHMGDEELMENLACVVATACEAIGMEEGYLLDPTRPMKYGQALIAGGIRRIAQLYERGADWYEERNWERGQTYSRIYDSLLRHAYQARALEKDEDHLAAVAWNGLALIAMILRGREDLNDLHRISSES